MGFLKETKGGGISLGLGRNAIGPESATDSTLPVDPNGLRGGDIKDKTRLTFTTDLAQPPGIRMEARTNEEM